MGRPSGEAVLAVKTKLAAKLEKETQDKVVFLEEGVFVRRLKGTEIVEYHDSNKGIVIRIADATPEDLPTLMHPALCTTVRGMETFKVDTSDFKSNSELEVCSRLGILGITDSITYKNCNGCPIQLSGEELMTKNTYCYTFCQVGLETQKLGVLYETKPRTRVERGRRADIKKVNKSNVKTDTGNIKTDSVIKAMKAVEKRQIKQLRLLYLKLTNPE